MDERIILKERFPIGRETCERMMVVATMMFRIRVMSLPHRTCCFNCFSILQKHQQTTCTGAKIKCSHCGKDIFRGQVNLSPFAHKSAFVISIY